MFVDVPRRRAVVCGSRRRFEARTGVAVPRVLKNQITNRVPQCAVKDVCVRVQKGGKSVRIQSTSKLDGFYFSLSVLTH